MQDLYHQPSDYESAYVAALRLGAVGLKLQGSVSRVLGSRAPVARLLVFRV